MDLEIAHAFPHEISEGLGFKPEPVEGLPQRFWHPAGMRNFRRARTGGVSPPLPSLRDGVPPFTVTFIPLKTARNPAIRRKSLTASGAPGRT